MFKQIRFFLIILSCSISLLLAAAPLTAQVEGPTIIKKNPGGGGTRGPRVVTVPGKTITVTKINTVKASNLTVSTEPGALVKVIPAKGGKPLSSTADNQGSVIFPTLAPGSYKVEATKADFFLRKEDTVIKYQTPAALNMDLKPVTYKLNLKANISGGSIIYSRTGDIGTATASKASVDNLSNYCVLALQPTGEIQLPDLRKGHYDVYIFPNSPEYEKGILGINVPNDTVLADTTDPGAVKTIPVNLDNRRSTDTFASTAWSTNDWNLPSPWRLGGGIKVRNVEGTALPKNPLYLYYINFEMIADVKFNDDGGYVGFALRAVNDKNYYLLQISATESSLYVVKNGLMQKEPIRTLAEYP